MSKKKWKKVLKVVLIILLILLVIAVINFIRKKNSKKQTADDFINLKEIIEYTGSEYYKSTESTEEGFEGDHYIKFSVDPVDETFPIGTNKEKYENTIGAIEDFLGFKNVRIIDESRKIVVRTSCNKENKKYSYTINGVEGYFEKKLATIQAEQNQEKISNFKITSPELNSIINVNWVRRNASLGTVDQALDGENYDRYEDEGYKTRVLGTKIYNIVFNENYGKDVIENIKPGTKLTDIVTTLGEPTYKDADAIEDCDYIGYKLSSCYVFFSDVISIYPVIEFDEIKNNQFAEAVSALKNGGSKSEFMSKLTEIYPNYNRLNTSAENKNYMDIEYALYGFGIYMNDNSVRIIIYNNYQGKIDNDTTVDELRLGLKSLSFVQTRFNENALIYEEADRIEGSI